MLLKKYTFVRSFLHFFHYAPWRMLGLNVLSVFMSIVGMGSTLLLIPLAQLAGLDISNYASQHGGVADSLIEFMGRFEWTKSLPKILLVGFLFTLFTASVNYFRGIAGVLLQQKYVRDMRAVLYLAVLESDWEYLSSKKTSGYLHRVATQVQGMNISAQETITLMHQLLFLLAMIVLMIAVHPTFTLLTICVGILLAIIILPIRIAVRDAGKKNLLGYQDIFATLAEHLSNLKVIKATGQEKRFHTAVDEISEKLEVQQVRMARVGSIISFTNAIGLSIAFSLLLYIGVTYLNMAVAEFVILMLVMTRILPLIAGMQSTIQGIVFSLPAFSDIEKLLEETSLNKEIVAKQEIERLPLNKSVSLRDVDFRYRLPAIEKIELDLIENQTTKPAQENPWLFKNMNISLPVNQTTVLRGSSGTGKSSIADMFANMLVPEKGGLYIDDKLLTDADKIAWRRSVAYVTQEVYLFSDSLYFNLTWPLSSPASEDDVWRALKMAAVDNVVKKLPEQLETNIGDRGMRFSGGERQRLAIARALLMCPKLLILDEATSALDNENESKIQEAIKRMHGELTILIIAHSKSTLEIADKIIDVAELRA